MMLKGLDMYDSKLRDTVHSVRNERVQSQMFGGKLRLHRVCVTYAGLMLLKNPEMSKRRRALAVPVAQVAWMQWTRVAMVSTALWCGWDLNWVMGIR